MVNNERKPDNLDSCVYKLHRGTLIQSPRNRFAILSFFRISEQTVSGNSLSMVSL